VEVGVPLIVVDAVPSLEQTVMEMMAGLTCSAAMVRLEAVDNGTWE
jgi:hypothetical protein